MPLQKALIEAPLSSGLGQQVDVRSLQVDGAATMTNCVRAKNGAIRKRPGCLQLNNAVIGKGFSYTQFDSVRGVNYGLAPLILDGFTCAEYSDSQAQWEYIDSTPEIIATPRIPISGSQQLGAFPGGASAFPLGGDLVYSVSRNIYVVVYCSTTISGGVSFNTITAVVIDGANNSILLAPVALTSATTDAHFPGIVLCGDTAVISWTAVSAGTQQLWVSKLNLASINTGWSAPVVLVTPIVSGVQGVHSPYDISAVANDSTRFLVAYFTATNATIAAINVSALTVQHSATVTYTNTPITITVAGASGEMFWVGFAIADAVPSSTFFAYGYQDSGGFTQTSTLNLYNNATGTALAGHMAFARVSATDSVLFWTVDAWPFPTPHIFSTFAQQVSSAGGGSTTSTIKIISGLSIFSKPIVLTTAVGTRCYTMMNVPSVLQGTLALVCFDWFGTGDTEVGTPGGARLITTIHPRLVKAFGGNLGLGEAPPLIPKIVGLASATTFATITYLSTSLNRVSIFIQPFESNSKQRFFGDVLSGSSLLGLSAGAPFTFDGQSIAEMGYLWYPEAVNTSPILSAGALTGTYSYLFTYEWVDGTGSIARSAVSPPLSVTYANQQGQFHLPCLGVTWRQRGAAASPVLFGSFAKANTRQTVKICIYRTVASGSVYYLAGSVSNDTTAATVLYTDNATDASISGTGAALVYTTGGVLDNMCPPTARIGVIHKNRWFLAGCDDPTAIWPSKAFTFGEVPGFNEQFNFNASGAVTGLASLDEKLIIFVQRGTGNYGIEYIVGEGPFDTGVGNDWTNPPQPIPSAAGAFDHRSIAVCELGVFFYSIVGGSNGQGGIFLLTRDLQVHYVSGPVENLIGQFQTCTAATVHPNAGRIYFEFASGDNFTSSTMGARLVYDYIDQCWSSDTHYVFSVSGNRGARTTFIAGGPGLTVNGTRNMPLVHWTDYAGRIYRETSGVIGANSHVDVSSSLVTQWVTATFSSAWLKPALSGFARFWRLQIQSDVEDTNDGAGFSLNVQFDYAPASFYTESSSWTSAQVAAFNRAPQCDVEHLVGNQKAKAIQVTLVDSPPIGPIFSGVGFNWATISIECGIDSSGRYQNLPPGQRG